MNIEYVLDQTANQYFKTAYCNINFCLHRSVCVNISWVVNNYFLHRNFDQKKLFCIPFLLVFLVKKIHNSTILRMDKNEEIYLKYFYIISRKCLECDLKWGKFLEQIFHKYCLHWKFKIMSLKFAINILIA